MAASYTSGIEECSCWCLFAVSQKCLRVRKHILSHSHILDLKPRSCSTIAFGLVLIIPLPSSSASLYAIQDQPHLLRDSCFNSAQ